MESDNADGPFIKAAFPYTQCCFHVVCKSSDPESLKFPGKTELATIQDVVLWCLPLLLDFFW